MKGKAFKLKIVLSIMLVLTAGLCFGLSITPKTIKEKLMPVAASTKVELGASSNKEEYSALFNGDIVFSAEKVKVSSTENEKGIPEPLVSFDKKFYATYDTTVDNETYTFNDIQSETSSKTVIDNGGFVKLDNIFDKNNVNKQFSIEGENSYQEAVLVSFGAYVYNSQTGVVTTATIDNDQTENIDETLHSGITYLDVIISQNGKQLDKTQVPELRNIRTSDNGAFFDFTFLITQQVDDTNEGFYEFKFIYMVNNKVEEASFSFYMVNNTSYTQNANPDGKDFGYNAKPTLGWVDGSNFEKNSAADDFVRYYIGSSGLGGYLSTPTNPNDPTDPTLASYPTITYDYTKYNLSYVHTANQKNTTHKLEVTYTSTANKDYAKMVDKVTASGVATIKEYQLNSYEKGAVNLVTIMLTEPGTYTFNYEFVYDGYVGTANPIPAFPTKEIRLSIHGLSTNYSKSGVEGAKMQYFEIATNNENRVDIIVPNGYQTDENISAYKDSQLGFMYKFVDGEVREGNILGLNSEDALINSYLNNKAINLGGNINKSFYEYLTSNDNFQYITKDHNIADQNTEREGRINNILTDLSNSGKYAKTNQGSLWLEGNDEYSENSFYFYSPAPLTKEDLFAIDTADSTKRLTKKKTLTNTTSFSSKGYYLVFAEIVPNGLKESEGLYWQVFAFQYATSATNIDVETLENGEMKAVANGKYTNKEVVVSWDIPGIFDREVKAYYYSVTNKNLTKEQLLSTTKNTLTGVEKDGKYQAVLGSKVVDDTFVRYLVRLESEGESATHKIFTIDKQKITGVQAYLVQELYSGNSVYYSYATDKNGYSISINNGVTDGYATLSWNNKASEAKIYATYSFTPFAINSAASETINGNNGTKWISTNYELGTTIVGAGLSKSSSPYLVESECVLFNQGIYIIDLWDDAGNKCTYAFVIDRTESFFNVEGNCVSNVSLLYGDDVNYSIGDYKVFNLETDNETLNDFIKKAASGKLNEFGEYYVGSGSNVTEISKLFQKLQSETDKYYFTIENQYVVAYEDKIIDTNIRVDSNGNGKLEYIQDVKNSYRRTIYVVGANHTYTTKDVKTHSYVTIEINKDNALGTVFYSNDSSFANIPAPGILSKDHPTLVTGNDLLDESGNVIENGIHGASATSAKHVAFVWNMGTGSFEVERVTYSFYTLKTQTYNGTENPDYGIYFYSSSENNIELYNRGTWTTALGAELLGDNSGRGIVRFNKTSDTKAGLYVVTREYKEVVGADLGDDVRVRKYYFIVDRNGIIETNIGDSIKINLMETESEFTSFSTQGAEKGVLRTSDGIDGDSYSIYLTTTKLPATLNIPTGKYYSLNDNKVVNTSAKYTAGQLNVSVYFYDRYNQLANQYRGRTIKIYQSPDRIQFSEDVFNIDIYEYLSKSDYPNDLIRDRIAESKENGTWLFLPGDYIVRITDNVVNTLGENHIKYIGLRIATYQDEGPEVEFFTGHKKDEMNKVLVENNKATVSQEFLKVVLPNYIKDETRKAQVDRNYIVVDQYVNNVKTPYLHHEYRPDGGISLTEQSEYVTISNGEISVWLDTKLRDDFGNIDFANLTRPLHYTITVRYKLNDFEEIAEDARISQLEKYKNCYVYYTTNGVRVDDFYYKTYTITIDREAPKDNINYLNQSDKLVEEYNKEFAMDHMFENGIHKTNSNLYFTNQYAKYYQNGQKREYVYVYRVNKDTPFNVKDVERIYIKSIPDMSALYLTLPVVDTSAYTKSLEAYTLDTGNGYGDYSGLGLTYNQYYEIVEVDMAGNATQYVVLYTYSKEEALANAHAEADAVVSIPFNVVTTLNETKVINVSSKQTLNENIFRIESNATVLANTYFFKVELERADGTNLFKCLTNISTDLEKLSDDIANILINEGFGSFNLKITTQTSSSVSHIKLYNEDIIDSLKTERLVKDENGKYYKNGEGKDSIYLLGANKKEIIGGQTVDFYATEITIKTTEATKTYVAAIGNNGTIKYYEKDFYEENKDNEAALKNHNIVYIRLKDNTTYLITMKDVFGDVAPYRFNTSGHEFVVIEFEDVDNDAEDDFYHKVEGKNHKYYGYTSATLKYDKAIYTSVLQGDTSIAPEVIGDAYEQYKFVAPLSNGKYAKVEYKVLLYYGDIKDENLEYTYHITIDTRLSSVSLREASSGAERNSLIKIFNNLDYRDNIVLDQSDSGRMTLYWNTIEENDYFNYDYRLYEELKDNKGYRKYKLVDGFYVESEDGETGLNLNGKTSTIIATREDSIGVYKFIISVYGKDGTYLGNRIYSFMVQEVDTQVYYVINKNGEEIKSMESFKFVDVKDLLLNDQRKFFYKEGSISDEDLLVNENINLPLFITNEDYVVRTTSLNVKANGPISIALDTNNKLYIYKISKDETYDIFIGVLKVNKTSDLIENVKVKDLEVGEQTSFTVAGKKTDEIYIYADRVAGEAIGDINIKNLIAKNKLMLDVMYNGKLVDSKEFNSSYAVLGNGQYSFVFKDMAGNVHEYTQDLDKNTPETEDRLNVYVLREVVVLINGEAPVNNAFYNEEVSLTIFASSKYVTGSINITARRNGTNYKFKGFNPYIFSDYGTYRVTITARYPGLDETLIKVVTFTILNANEATTSMDLTGLKISDISKILNPRGEDITNNFKGLLTAGGMKVSYEDIMAYESTASKEEKLNVTTGKMIFTVIYVAKDGIYPDRELTLRFTLNNEKPKIVCSLKTGESTTKSFTISFNEAVIYDQVGESYIYINNKLVAHITEDSLNKEQKFKTSYKSSGDGDYYVKLVSSSGVVLDSYKVTIQEPLNTWAIIVIVVAVGVVLTVTITVIVLRRKMRIR